METARPVVFIMGRLLVGLGAVMLVPCVVDWALYPENVAGFLTSALITMGVGFALSLSSANGLNAGLTIRQAYLLTAVIWVGLPLFGSMPFTLAAPGLSFTDAYFEAVSGITTTGSTVIVGLDSLPPGMNLWRGLLNWIGGLGIAFIAMIFFPIMRLGGCSSFGPKASTPLARPCHVPPTLQERWSMSTLG